MSPKTNTSTVLIEIDVSEYCVKQLAQPQEEEEKLSTYSNNL